MSSISNLLRDCNKPVAAAGNGIEIKMIPLCELEGYPQTEHENDEKLVTPAQKKTLKQEFAYKPVANEGYFRRAQVKLNSPIGGFKMTGEGSAAGFENSVEFMFIDDSVDAMNFCDELVKGMRCDCPYVLCLENKETGTHLVIGRPNYGAYVTAIEGTTGDKIGGTARGVKITMSALDSETPRIYPREHPFNYTPNT